MCLIGIGANLPGPGHQTPLATCREAVQALDEISGLHLAGLSNWYESEPQPPSDQPVYVNAIAQLAGACDPVWLLGELQRIERRFGRTRGAPNAARTLDLDIIAMGRIIRVDEDPVLPHPRMHVRAFVLVPLRDVAPDWRHPVSGRSVAELLAGLPAQGIRQAVLF